MALSLGIAPGIRPGAGAVPVSTSPASSVSGGGGGSTPTVSGSGGGSAPSLPLLGVAPIVFAINFPGADIGAKINAALVALTNAGGQKGPGTIIVPAGSFAFATPIDLRESRSVRITTQTGNLNSVTDWGPNLIWTGGAAGAPALADPFDRGAAVKAQGSVGLEWDHVNLSYNNPAYNGNLFSLGAGGVMNTGTAHIHHCRISGTPAALLAARLIELNVTLAFTLEHCSLDYAVDGVGCSGPSNNVIVIGNGCWFDKHFSGSCIRASGNDWLMQSVVAESDPNAGVPLTPFFRLAGDCSSLRFWGCESLDGGTGGGTVIDLSGFNVLGADISMTCAHASGTMLRCSDVAGQNVGINVHGSRFHSNNVAAVGCHFGSANGVSCKGNTLICGTPWTGTAPTLCSISDNHEGNFGGVAGVPVANAATIAISPPGSANDGFGFVLISCPQDGSHAIFSLNGALGTTTEFLDPAGHYTAAVGGANATNIYWDGPTNSYRLQNLRGATRTYVVTYVGR